MCFLLLCYFWLVWTSSPACMCDPPKNTLMHRSNHHAHVHTSAYMHVTIYIYTYYIYKYIYIYVKHLYREQPSKTESTNNPKRNCTKLNM